MLDAVFYNLALSVASEGNSAVKLGASLPSQRYRLDDQAASPYDPVNDKKAYYQVLKLITTSRLIVTITRCSRKRRFRHYASNFPKMRLSGNKRRSNGVNPFTYNWIRAMRMKRKPL